MKGNEKKKNDDNAEIGKLTHRIKNSDTSQLHLQLRNSTPGRWESGERDWAGTTSVATSAANEIISDIPQITYNRYCG